MEKDIENNQPFLLNQTVHSLSWSDITVSVNDGDLIQGIDGVVKQGELHLRGPLYINGMVNTDRIRRTGRPNGPLRKRQNNPPERPRAPHSIELHRRMPREQQQARQRSLRADILLR